MPVGTWLNLVWGHAPALSSNKRKMLQSLAVLLPLLSLPCHRDYMLVCLGHDVEGLFTLPHQKSPVTGKKA